MKRHVDEPSWKLIAVQGVDDESDGSFVPARYEKWKLPVCQGVLNVIWKNVTCVGAWDVIDDDSWTVVEVCPIGGRPGFEDDPRPGMPLGRLGCI